MERLSPRQPVHEFGACAMAEPARATLHNNRLLFQYSTVSLCTAAAPCNTPSVSCV